MSEVITDITTDPRDRPDMDRKPGHLHQNLMDPKHQRQRRLLASRKYDLAIALETEVGHGRRFQMLQARASWSTWKVWTEWRRW